MPGHTPKERKKSTKRKKRAKRNPLTAKGRRLSTSRGRLNKA